MKIDRLTASYLALRDKLHRSAIGFLQDEEDAKDALQDTFSKLWSRGNVDSDAEARNKLFKVLRNVCIDRLRETRLERIDVGVADSVEARTDGHSEVVELERLLTASLTETQRIIYQMIVHEGYEYEEVSSRLNMSVEAVRMNMSRIRKKIREIYNRLNR